MRFLLWFAVVLAVSFPALAAKESMTPAFDMQKERDTLDADQKKLMQGMTEDQSKALAEIGTGFGMLRAVNIVRKDVGRAVDKCGSTNPGLKKQMSERFKEWSGKVTPLVKSNETKMNQAISSGIFKSPGKVKAYLDKVDNVAIRADQSLHKEVLTDEDSCNDLLSSMDETQSTVVDILSKMEWPSPPAPADKTSQEKKITHAHSSGHGRCAAGRG